MASTLSRAIESVMNQTYPDWEMIVVDSDDVVAVATPIGQYGDDVRIRSFYGVFQDRSEARNYGISQSTGDYITFLDADDAISPEYLSEFVHIFNHKPDCVVISDILKIEGGIRRHWHKAGLFDGNRLRYAVNEGNITFAARRKHFITRPFRFNFWEDKLWLGATGERLSFQFTGKPYYQYYITSKLYTEADFKHSMAIELEAINTLYSDVSLSYRQQYPLASALNDFYIKKAYVALAHHYLASARELITGNVKFQGSIKTMLRVIKLRLTYLRNIF